MVRAPSGTVNVNGHLRGSVESDRLTINSGGSLEWMGCPTPADQPPTVNAGASQTITLPGAATLSGTVTDDGLPAGGSVTSTWSKLSGPGIVTFANANATATSASFSVAGTYVLRLTASDTQLTATSDVTITVNAANQPPIVSAGTNQTITLPSTASLQGTVTDDGRPAGGTLTTSWSKVSGLGTVTFANPNAAATTAAFSAAGSYVLRLSASDSQLSGSAQITINVNPANQPPTVNAGPDQTIKLRANLLQDGGNESALAGNKIPFWTEVNGSLWTQAAAAGGAGNLPFSLEGNTYFYPSGSTTMELRQDVDVSAFAATIAAGTQGFEFKGYVRASAELPPDGSRVIVEYRDAANTATLASFDSGESSSSEWTPVSDTSLAPPGTRWIRVRLIGSNKNAGADGGLFDALSLRAASGAATYLNGVAGDDGLPAGSTVSATWSKVSGPGAVTFANPASATTAATFGAAGSYMLRLSASDSALIGNDDVIVTVTQANQPPSVNAGTGSTISLPQTLNLSGTVSDDGLPAGGSISVSWDKASGPGAVTFANGNAISTTATFSAAGVYALRLSASDSEFTFSDEVRVTVEAANVAPTVNAGADQTITLPGTATLNATVSDDNLPSGVTNVLTWSKTSGPGNVTFADSHAASTTATFSAAGAYVLRLEADDSEYTSESELTVNVNPDTRVNQPPTVSAGANQSLTLPANVVSLQGTATDDGLPAGGALNVVWNLVNGPGPVTFSDRNSLTTTATLGAATGTYLFRLTAGDSQLTSSSDVTVTVNASNQAPTVNAGADQTILLTDAATLQGTASDDGLPAGSSVSVAWTKMSGTGTVAFVNPSAAATTATFSEAGTYVLRLTATDTELQASDEVTITVNPAQPPPVVELLTPTEGAEITSPTDVVGSVSNGAWKLEYSLNTDDGANNQAWTTFATGNGQVTNNRLGTVDSTLMLNGIYTVRLSATDNYGQTSAATTSVLVDKNLKIGNFTVAFTDLSVPVAGLPIEVTRIYDSRDKRKGDFGVGWTLGISNVHLEKSNVLGRHWYQTASNTFPPNYCFVETKPHVVTITFPDGNFYKFQAAPAQQCQRFAPISSTNLVFTPMSGTRGKLTVEGSTEIQVAGSIPGPVDLLTFSDPDIFNASLFHLSTEDGRDYLIDQKGGVRKVTDQNGNYLMIDANGVTHSSGKSITFTRDPEGRITQITDPSGNAQTYTYDSNSNLVSYKDRENNISTYTYNSTHGMLTLSDPRGLQPIRNEYDDSGRLLSNIDAFGKKIQYEHDLAARSDIMTDRLGNQTRHEYDAHGNILRSVDAKGGVKLFTYDADDNVLTETNALGKMTAYTYDSEGHRTSITDPLGNVTRYTYNSQGKVLTTIDPLSHMISNTYDGAGNLLKTKDALGNETTNGYNAFDGLLVNTTDALGGMTSYSYTNGALTKVTDVLGGVTTYTYDANGNRASQSITRTTSAGATETLTTQFQYDRLNRLTKTTYPDGSTIQVEYNSIGQESAVIDQLDHRTTYDYDEMGRLLKTTFADGTKEESTYNAEGRKLTSKDRAGRMTSYAYDELGRMTKLIYPDGTFTTTTYDAIGRATASTDERGQTTLFEYDPNCGCSGRRSKITNALNQVMTFSYDGNGNELSKTDANNHTTTYEYDVQNRRTKVKYEDGTSLTTAYDAIGRIKSKTDQAGKTTQFEYDKLGRLIKVTDALNQVTVYTYNEVGQQIAETDAGNHTTRYEYDKMGRRLKRALPLGMSEAYTYDAAGRIQSRTDFNGKVTTYSYDLLGRLLQKTPDASFNQPAVTFTYTTAGLRQTMSDASGVTTYSYDSRDHLKSKQTPEGTLNYTYDEAGNLKTVRSSNPNGVSVDYTYDQLNRLSTISDGNLQSGASTTTYSYDSAGNLQGYVYPNGVQTTHVYNSLNRLTSLIAGNSSATTLASYIYTLGATGNRLSVTELNGRTADYVYDDLYRLTKETVSNDPLVSSNGAVNYTYDEAGNRLTCTATLAGLSNQTFAYDANSRLASDTHDSNGSTITSNGTAYSFDWENRLTGVNNGGISYLYDGDGNRVTKRVAGVTTRYLVDTNNLTGYAQVADEIVGTSVQRTYAYGHDLISENQLVGGNWSVSYYGYDGHGSVRYLTGNAGTITDTYTYDAFGGLLAATGTTPNEYLYAGERFDAETGFYYLRARQMNPSTGRFWEMDDYEGHKNDPRSLHKYLYTYDDPVNQADPSGRNISIAGQMVTIGVLVTLAALSVATVCAYQWAVTNTLDAVDIDYSSAPPSPCIKRPDPRLTFYRGTTFFDAEETVQTQHIDVGRIMAHQSDYGFDPDRLGVYFTSQLTTAIYYADLVGGEGRGNGIGLIIATTRANRFSAFAARWGIAIEAPVPNPPTPGQTETLIPFAAMPEFETFTKYRR